MKTRTHAVRKAKQRLATKHSLRKARNWDSTHILYIRTRTGPRLMLLRYQGETNECRAYIFQDPDVWPEATVSLCIWHIVRASKEHLGGRNIHPLATHSSHSPIEYGDRTIWERSASFLEDTAWIQHQNEGREALYRQDAKRRCSPNSTPQDVERFIIKECNSRNASKQLCCANPDALQKILSKMDEHTRFHPMIMTPPDEWNSNHYNPWPYQEAQVMEMHNLCKELAKSWAQEYLWKQWYYSTHWRI